MSIQFDWVKPLSSGAGRTAGDSMSAKKTRSGTSVSGEIRYQLGITIPEEAMKKARIVIGDKVEVGFAYTEEKGLLLGIRRVIGRGYAVTTTTGSAKGSVKKHQGQSVRAKVQVGFRDGFPDDFLAPVGNYDVDENGTLIAWEGKNGQ